MTCCGFFGRVCTSALVSMLEEGGMHLSRDSPVLMIPSLVHLGQPGPDVCQVGTTRASVCESKQFGEERVRKLSSELQ